MSNFSEEVNKLIEELKNKTRPIICEFCHRPIEYETFNEEEGNFLDRNGEVIGVIMGRNFSSTGNWPFYCQRCFNEYFEYP